MSSAGIAQAELERRERDRLRLAMAIEECERCLAAFEARVASVSDAATQQLVATELRAHVDRALSARARVRTAPEATRDELRRLLVDLEDTLARGEANARDWSERRRRVVAEQRALAALGVRVVVGDDLDRAEADLAARRGDLEHERAEELARRERREVARAYYATLQGLGFRVASEEIDDVVVLEGKLRDGRRARVELRLDGEVHYDLDGYVGRECSAHLERIEASMRERFVKTEPKQFVWHTDDVRIGKSARSIPRSAPSTKRGGR